MLKSKSIYRNIQALKLANDKGEKRDAASNSIITEYSRIIRNNITAPQTNFNLMVMLHIMISNISAIDNGSVECSENDATFIYKIHQYVTMCHTTKQRWSAWNTCINFKPNTSLSLNFRDCVTLFLLKLLRDKVM